MRMKYSICWSSGSRPRAEDAARAMDTAVSVSPLPCHHARTEAVINSLGVTPKQLLKFVEKHGIVLQAARGPVPSLAEHITGEPIKGSWWGHAKGHEIFELLSRVSEHPDVLVCKLVEGKITYVHRRVWPALVKLAARFDQSRLAQVANEHTASGAHRAVSNAFPKWVPEAVAREARGLSVAEAEQVLSPLFARGGISPTQISRARRIKANSRTTMLATKVQKKA